MASQIHVDQERVLALERNLDEAIRTCRWDEAERLCNHIIKMVPGRSPQARSAKNRLHEIRRKREAHQKVEELLEEAERSFKEGHFQEAATKFDQALNWGVQYGIFTCLPADIEERRLKALKADHIRRQLEAALQEAGELERQGKLREALQTLTSLEVSDPAALRPYPLLAQLFERWRAAQKRLHDRVKQKDVEQSLYDLVAKGQYVRAYRLLQTLRGPQYTPLIRHFQWLSTVTEDLKKVRKAVQEERWDEAIARARELAEELEEDAFGKEELVRTYSAAGEFYLEQGIKALRKEQLPEAVEALEKAHRYFQQGQSAAEATSSIAPEQFEANLERARQLLRVAQHLAALPLQTWKSRQELQDTLAQVEGVGSAIQDPRAASIVQALVSALSTRLKAHLNELRAVENHLRRAEEALEKKNLTEARNAFEWVLESPAALEEHRRQAEAGLERVREHQRRYQACLQRASATTSLDERLRAVKEAYEIWPTAPEMPGRLVQLYVQAAEEYLNEDPGQAARLVEEAVALVGEVDELVRVRNLIEVVPQAEALLEEMAHFSPESYPEVASALEEARRLDKRAEELVDKLRTLHQPAARHLRAQLTTARERLREHIGRLEAVQEQERKLEAWLNQGRWNEAQRELEAFADASLVSRPLREAVERVVHAMHEANITLERLEAAYQQLAEQATELESSRVEALKGEAQGLLRLVKGVAAQITPNGWRLPPELERAQDRAGQLERRLDQLQQALEKWDDPLEALILLQRIPQADDVVVALRRAAERRVREWSQRQLEQVERRLASESGLSVAEEAHEWLGRLLDAGVLDSEQHRRVEELFVRAERRQEQEKAIQDTLKRAEEKAIANDIKGALNAYRRFFEVLRRVDGLPQEAEAILHEVDELVWPHGQEEFPLTDEETQRRLQDLIKELLRLAEGHWCRRYLTSGDFDTWDSGFFRLARVLHTEQWRDSAAEYQNYIEAYRATKDLLDLDPEKERRARELHEYRKRMCTQVASSVQKRVREAGYFLNRADVERARQQLEEARREFLDPIEEFRGELQGSEVFELVEEAQSALEETEQHLKWVQQLLEQVDPLRERVQAAFRKGHLEEVERALEDIEGHLTAFAPEREERIPEALREQVSAWRRRAHNWRLERELQAFRKVLADWRIKSIGLEAPQDMKEILRQMESTRTEHAEWWKHFPEEVRSEYESLYEEIKRRLERKREDEKRSKEVLELLRQGQLAEAAGVLEEGIEAALPPDVIALLRTLRELEERWDDLLAVLGGDLGTSLTEHLQEIRRLFVRARSLLARFTAREPASPADEALHQGLMSYSALFEHRRQAFERIQDGLQVLRDARQALELEHLKESSPRDLFTTAERLEGKVRQLDSLIHMLEQEQDKWADEMWASDLHRQAKHLRTHIEEQSHTLRSRAERALRLHQSLGNIEQLRREGNLQEAWKQAHELMVEFPDEEQVRQVMAELSRLLDQVQELEQKVNRLGRERRFSEAWKAVQTASLPLPETTRAHLERQILNEEQQWIQGQRTFVRDQLERGEFEKALSHCDRLAERTVSEEDHQAVELLRQECVDAWAMWLVERLREEDAPPHLFEEAERVRNWRPRPRQDVDDRLREALRRARERSLDRQLQQVKDFLEEEEWEQARALVEEVFEQAEAWELSKQLRQAGKLRAQIEKEQREAEAEQRERERQALLQQARQARERARARDDLEQIVAFLERSDYKDDEEVHSFISRLRDEIRLYDQTKKALEACRRHVQAGQLERAQEALRQGDVSPLLSQQYQQWKELVDLWNQARRAAENEDWNRLFELYARLREQTPDAALLHRLEQEEENARQRWIRLFQRRLEEALSHVPPDVAALQQMAEAVEKMPGASEHMKRTVERALAGGEALARVAKALEAGPAAAEQAQAAWSEAKNHLSEVGPRAWQQWEPAVDFLTWWQHEQWDQAEAAWARLGEPIQAWPVAQAARDRMRRARELQREVSAVEATVRAKLQHRPVDWTDVVKDFDAVSPEVRALPAFEALRDEVTTALNADYQKAMAERRFAHARRLLDVWLEIEPNNPHLPQLVQALEEQWQRHLDEARREVESALDAWDLERAGRFLERWERLAEGHTPKTKQHIERARGRLEALEQIRREAESALRAFQQAVQQDDWEHASRIWHELGDRLRELPPFPPLAAAKEAVRRRLEARLERATATANFPEAYRTFDVLNRLGVHDDVEGLRHQLDAQLSAWLDERLRHVRQALDVWDVEQAGHLLQEVEQMAKALPVGEIAPTAWQAVQNLRDEHATRSATATAVRRQFYQAWQSLQERQYVNAQQQFLALAGQHHVPEAQKWAQAVDALLEALEQARRIRESQWEEALQALSSAQSALEEARKTLCFDRPEELPVHLLSQTPTWRRQFLWFVARLSNQLNEIISRQQEAVRWRFEDISRAFDMLTQRDVALQGFEDLFEQGMIGEPPPSFDTRCSREAFQPEPVTPEKAPLAEEPEPAAGLTEMDQTMPVPPPPTEEERPAKKEELPTPSAEVWPEAGPREETTWTDRPAGEPQAADDRPEVSHEQAAETDRLAEESQAAGVASDEWDDLDDWEAVDAYDDLFEDDRPLPTYDDEEE